MITQPLMPTGRPARTDSGWSGWIARVAAVAGVLVVAWVCLTSWGAIVHGHPLYGVLLGVTLLGAVLVGVRSFRPSQRRAGWRRVAHVAVLLLALGWVALLAWLRPFTAVEPALAALRSDTRITITETPTRIVLTPTGPASTTGVFFQPGARVDSRAYVAILRPVAEAGHVVVIAKQPLGIAFLARKALDATAPGQQYITRWVVGGHSLGGTVAAMQADAADTDPTKPVVGLLLFASYPASDISTSLRAPVLSIAGSRDGLATPDKIAASSALLPAASTFLTVEGAVHSFFGDYGPQPGDGTPTISHDEARAVISRAAVDFVDNPS